MNIDSFIEWNLNDAKWRIFPHFSFEGKTWVMEHIQYYSECMLNTYWILLGLRVLHESLLTLHEILFPFIGD